MSTKSTSKHWMAVGEACHLLEVNDSTLRQWADNGLIRCYRTPGGHRRFSAEAIRALIGRQSEQARRAREPQWAERALQRVRRRLRSNQTVSQQWRQALSSDSRTRMRLLGRRLLSIAADHSTQPRLRVGLLEEARLIGDEYGAAMTRSGVPLQDALQAFVFFRSFLLEMALGSASGGLGEPTRLWRSVEALSDQMLLSMATHYEATPEVASTPVGHTSN